MFGAQALNSSTKLSAAGQPGCDYVWAAVDGLDSLSTSFLMADAIL